MLLFAATTLDKLKQVPPAFWLKVGLAVLIIIGVVLVLRMVAHMNRFVVAAVLFIALAIFGVNMVYNRTEPAFLTPVVDKVAPFLPSAGAYGAKQGTPGHP